MPCPAFDEVRRCTGVVVPGRLERRELARVERADAAVTYPATDQILSGSLNSSLGGKGANYTDVVEIGFRGPGE